MRDVTLHFERIHVPPRLAALQPAGSCNISRWVAQIPSSKCDEVLRLMVSQDPAGVHDALLWHLSLSVVSKPYETYPLQMIPELDTFTRLPTKRECKAVVTKFGRGHRFGRSQGSPQVVHLWQAD